MKLKVEKKTRYSIERVRLREGLIGNALVLYSLSESMAAAVPEPQKKLKKDENPNDCNFCGSEAHVKKHCTNYHAWHAKKVMLLSLVCSKFNLTLVPRHTWWLDSAATTHISVSMQDFLSCRKASDDERYIYVGDGNPMKVEAIGNFILSLRIGFFLDLIGTPVVPSLRRNLVFVLVLDTSGYCCSFGNGKVILYQNSNLVLSGSLLRYDNLYLLDTIASFNESLHVSTVGIKRKLTNENLPHYGIRD